MPTLHINKQRVKKKEGKAPLFFKHTINGKAESFQLNIAVEPERWDKKMQRVEGDSTLTEEITHKRQLWSIHLQNILREEFTINEIKQIFQRHVNGKRRNGQASLLNQKVTLSYYELMDKYHANNQPPKQTIDTIRKVKTVKHSLQKVFDYLGLSDLTYDNLSQYFNYLLDKEMANSTIDKYFSVMSTVVKYGRSLGYSIPFDKSHFKVDQYESVKVWLTAQELKAMEEVEVKKHEEKIKDWFLFRCYTGVRHSDMKHIHIGNLEGSYLQFNLQKQRRRHRIPIGAKGLAVLMKYKQWPVYKLQLENRVVKDIAERAKLTREIEHYKYSGTKLITKKNKLHEIISTHDARRTFGRLQYDRGASITEICEMYGHKSERVTKIYLDLGSTDLSHYGI